MIWWLQCGALCQHTKPLPTWINFVPGLDFDKDVIIEIAVIITDGELLPVDPGINYVIRTEKRLLDGMDEWCTRTHGV
jgi:oligoribonuclease